LEKVDPIEIPILTLGQNPLPSTRRTIGGFLMEGPRPVRMQIEGEVFYIIGFSSGDFPTDSYTINYAWSRRPQGPYRPMLNSASSDLLDLGLGIKNEFGLSWVGRPVFYRNPEGQYEILFHGVLKSILRDNDYRRWPKKYQLWQFFRCIFKANLATRIRKGQPLLLIDTKLKFSR
jgi:hypothetical protein